MNDPNKLREISWRRKLTAAEAEELRAWLAEHPESQADWELELGLSESLSRMADAPVSTNFTARVLQEVGREATAVRRAGWNWSWRSFLPKAALAMIGLVVGLGFYQQQRAVWRTEFARNVVEVSKVVAVPEPVVMQDFEVISQMSEPDQKLLALLE